MTLSTCFLFIHVADHEVTKVAIAPYHCNSHVSNLVSKNAAAPAFNPHRGSLASLEPGNTGPDHSASSCSMSPANADAGSQPFASPKQVQPNYQPINFNFSDYLNEIDQF